MTIMIMKVTKPQAVIRPFTSLNISVIRQRSSQCNKTASGNLAFHKLNTMLLEVKTQEVTKPQAVIWPFTLWLAHGSQSGLKALQWKIETLFIAKTADLLTTAVIFRLCKKQNALGARLAELWQMICLL